MSAEDEKVIFYSKLNKVVLTNSPQIFSNIKNFSLNYKRRRYFKLLRRDELNVSTNGVHSYYVYIVHRNSKISLTFFFACNIIVQTLSSTKLYIEFCNQHYFTVRKNEQIRYLSKLLS